MEYWRSCALKLARPTRTECSPDHSTCQFSPLCRPPPGRLPSLAATVATFPSISESRSSIPAFLIKSANSVDENLLLCPFVIVV